MSDKIGKANPVTFLPLNIHLRSEGNIYEHWAPKRNRRLYQQNIAAQQYYIHGLDIKRPVRITLIRKAPRELDDDNLVTAFKWIRDRVAALIVPGKKPGRADNVKGIEWRYAQEKDKKYSVLIKFESLEKEKSPKKGDSS